MRGLAFPSNAAVDREPSYEYGTPISNVDDIPIDPALGGGAIDPALMMEDEGPIVAQQHPPQNQYLQPPQPPQDDYQARQYSEGPQGDPFAPQIPVPYFPMEQKQPPPPPKPKRKRKIVREEECSFCGGKDTNNKHNEPEALITCHECGRSGHPSCMQLERLSDVVRTYPWKCIECKNCEVCQEKGDDDRILFCDWCDRGWHMDCMDPPLLTAPEGEWHCPECPPVVPADQLPPPPEQYAMPLPEEAHVQSPIPSMRETSVASTSRSAIAPDPPVTAPKSRSRKKAPAKPRVRAPTRAAAAADDGEASDNDNSVAVDETPTVAPRARGRTSRGAAAAAASTSTAKGKARAPSTSSEDEPAPARPLKRRRAPARQPSPTPAAPLPRVRLRIPAQRGKGKEREEDEHGMFDDILTPEERDTTKTKVLNIDKVYFERSRLAAEEKLAPPPPPTASSSRTPAPDEPLSARSRPLRSSTLHTPLKRPDLTLSSLSLSAFSLHSNSPAPSTPGGAPQYPKFDPGTLRIRSIRFGPWEIKTWYDAPFPEEYATIPDGRLWICEFCLKYMKSRFGAVRHQMKCKTRHPPGDEIYRDGNVSIFEVDGRRNKIYCQNLCLLSKMFLDHKSLFYDVEPFLFYVITQVDEFGARFVGYFSKEKRCPKDYNLSCIMTLPVRQRQGWGNFVIDFSYLLSKVEQRLGSPEKPLSSLGALGYKNYWTLAVMRFLATAADNVKLEEISSATSMTHEDVCNTLIQQNMLFIREPTPPPIKPSPGQAIKYPKGRKNGIARRQLQRLQSQQHLHDKEGSDGKGRPFALPKHYEIHFDRAKVQEYVANWEKKGYMRLKPEKLQWTPYIVSRTSQEAGVAGDQPAMDTVRDELGRTPFVLEDGDCAGQTQQERRETSTEPATPGPVNGRRRRVEEEDEDEDERKRDELPSMVVDRTSSPEPEPLVRTRTRSGVVKSTTKEKEDHPRLKKTSRARSPSPTPLAPSASRRTRSTNSNIPAPPTPAVVVVDEPRSTRRSGNTNSRRPPPPKATADDAALAAKLAAEEEEKQRPTRMLRSRRSESQVENKKPAAMVVVQIPSPTKPPPPRKRRRIESSPELEAPSPPPAEPEEVEEDAPMDVDLVNGRCQEEEESSPVGLTPENTDATTLVDVPNGSATTEEPEEVEMKVFMSGKFSPYRPVHAESDLRSTLVDDLHDEDADGEYEEDADGEMDPEFM